MKNTLRFFGAIAFLLVTVSTFAANSVANPITGVYGVCDCSSGSDNKQVIELRINEDGTFHYIDNADPSNQRTISGTWTTKGNKVILTSSDRTTSFHRKWKYVNDDKCIRSRHVLNFRRICLVKPC